MKASLGQIVDAKPAIRVMLEQVDPAKALMDMEQQVDVEEEESDNEDADWTPEQRRQKFEEYVNERRR